MALVFAFLIALTAVAAPSQDKTPGGTSAEPPSPEHVQCRACDEKGRVDCARCEGTGKIHKTCERCEGTSKRLCRVCDNPNSFSESEAGPGSVVCSYCGGSGTLGNTGKRCAKCRGEGLHKCETCRGRGTLKCKPTIYAGVCGDCRLAKKVPCTICDGTKWVHRSKIEKPTRRGAKSGASGQTTKSRTASRVDRAKEPKARTAEEVERRFASLTELRLSEGEVDTTRLRKVVGEQLGKAKRAERDLEATLASLPRGSGEKITGELNALRRRTEETQRRIRKQLSRVSDVDSLLAEFDSFYVRCQKHLAARPEGPFKTKRQKDKLDDWIGDMSYSLRNCEKRAVKLAENPPSEVEEISNALDKELESLTAAVKVADQSVAAALAEEDTIEPKPGGSSSKKSSRRSPTKRSGRRGGDSTKNDDENTVETDLADDGPGRKRSSKSKRRKDDEAYVEDGEEEPGGGSLLIAAISGLLGFGAAGVVFLISGRRGGA